MPRFGTSPSDRTATPPTSDGRFITPPGREAELVFEIIPTANETARTVNVVIPTANETAPTVNVVIPPGKDRAPHRARGWLGRAVRRVLGRLRA